MKERGCWGFVGKIFFWGKRVNFYDFVFVFLGYFNIYVDDIYLLEYIYGEL